MFDREKMQPEDWILYILFDKDGNGFIGRWLCGKDSYEGWYVIHAFSDDKLEDKLPAIFSQKELKVKEYVALDDFNSGNYVTKHYVPRHLLDEAFYGHDRIEDFRCTPDILCYI